MILFFRNADVAQGYSTSLVGKGSRVQFPSSADLSYRNFDSFFFYLPELCVRIKIYCVLLGIFIIIILFTTKEGGKNESSN